MDSMDASLSELRELVMDREAAKSQTQLSDWTELTDKGKESEKYIFFFKFIFYWSVADL